MRKGSGVILTERIFNFAGKREVRDHLVTAADAGYISKDEYDGLDILAQRVAQTLNGYIRSTRKKLGEAESRD
ncbi:MAG TPA: hypothetical protein VMU53_14645 [Candidatus Sulfotelmatobacter sp.]|nr:hypothetical protein [Candidatus Sulfotelmatobacter sp.]